MNIVFLHQNMPGQFKHLAALYARSKDNRVVFVTKRRDVEIPGVRRLVYAPSRTPRPETHLYLRRAEDAVLHGQGAARCLLALKQEGFVPDIIVGHSGWGEPLFAKDVFPNTPFLAYSEFYYRGEGADIGFDPAFPSDLDVVLRSRIRNTHLLLALEACDRALTATRWQRSVHPSIFHEKISVIHEGIDTGVAKPDPDAVFTLPDGRSLSRRDEVVTYVARNLEPYRGFVPFMRALPHLCEARPNAHVLVIGGDDVSYGSRPADAPNWREKMLAEVPVDPARVSFLGRVPYGTFLKALQVSSAHVYLTYPFVLSWSLLEAMAAGCTIVGSRTAPVQEVIEDGVNGLLVDFFDHEAIARTVAGVLAAREDHAALGAAARRTVAASYELADCVRRQTELIEEVAGVRVMGVRAMSEALS